MNGMDGSTSSFAPGAGGHGKMKSKMGDTSAALAVLLQRKNVKYRSRFEMQKTRANFLWISVGMRDRCEYSRKIARLRDME